MEYFFIVTLTKLDKNVVFCLDYLLANAEWDSLHPNSGRKSILCRCLSADFRRWFLSCRGNHSLSWVQHRTSHCQRGKEGRRMQPEETVWHINYTSKNLLKVKNIKLPKKPKSFICEDNLSDKNIVQHSRILGVKKYDVCN